MVFTPLPHHTLTAEILRWVVEPRARLYIYSKYSPRITRSPLPRWQVKIASRRASRRASQTRHFLSLPPNTPHPLQPVQHAARVSARRDLPRSPAIKSISTSSRRRLSVLYCLGKQRRSSSRLHQNRSELIASRPVGEWVGLMVRVAALAVTCLYHARCPMRPAC